MPKSTSIDFKLLQKLKSKWNFPSKDVVKICPVCLRGMKLVYDGSKICPNCEYFEDVNA